MAEAQQAQQAQKRTLAEVDAEIAQVKKELEDVHGEPAEVYARIVGYYRSVRQWNAGKSEEFKERKVFRGGGEAGLKGLLDLRYSKRAPCCGNEAIEGAHKEIDAKAEEQK